MAVHPVNVYSWNCLQLDPWPITLGRLEGFRRRRTSIGGRAELRTELTIVPYVLIHSDSMPRFRFEAMLVVNTSP